ncbi:hypothetical protein [Streptomyces sp. NPDC093676]|uniref:hypothetical protein n=1 Tax=Streptomyces sp. NPDC093676 TaxID=3366050 RepID=UPI00380AB602
MARVRYLGPEPVTVPELNNREVHPDEVVEVPDDRFDGYVCQTTNWEPIEEPGAKSTRKTAAKPQKEEG